MTSMKGLTVILSALPVCLAYSKAIADTPVLDIKP
jgi:MFS superfamily sulfate permease-like transporter